MVCMYNVQYDNQRERPIFHSSSCTNQFQLQDFYRLCFCKSFPDHTESLFPLNSYNPMPKMTLQYINCKSGCIKQKHMYNATSREQYTSAIMHLLHHNAHYMYLSIPGAFSCKNQFFQLNDTYIYTHYMYYYS